MCVKLVGKGLVEAAGVEPASEKEVNKENYMLIRFERFRDARLESARNAHH